MCFHITVYSITGAFINFLLLLLLLHFDKNSHWLHLEYFRSIFTCSLDMYMWYFTQAAWRVLFCSLWKMNEVLINYIFKMKYHSTIIQLKVSEWFIVKDLVETFTLFFSTLENRLHNMPPVYCHSNLLMNLFWASGPLNNRFLYFWLNRQGKERFCIRFSEVEWGIWSLFLVVESLKQYCEHILFSKWGLGKKNL